MTSIAWKVFGLHFYLGVIYGWQKDLGFRFGEGSLLFVGWFRNKEWKILKFVNEFLCG